MEEEVGRNGDGEKEEYAWKGGEESVGDLGVGETRMGEGGLGAD